MYKDVITAPTFRVITGKQVVDIVETQSTEIISVIEAAYRQHHHGRTVNPDSYFLNFPDNPTNRIIALPASIKAKDKKTEGVTGIKWISSFPKNIESGLPRASAVLILNDSNTGYPLACMEASVISAARTAASAASMARVYLEKKGRGAAKLSIIGAGLISRYVTKFIAAAGIKIEGIRIFDLNTEYSTALAKGLSQTPLTDVLVADGINEAIAFGDIVLFATNAGVPHVNDENLFSHNPLVLHLSLRDISPNIILKSHNVVDDVEHCMKANTSLHLTEAIVKNRTFVTSSLPEILAGGNIPGNDKPTIFSPFGMGILDIALGAYILAELDTEANVVDNFFYDLKRT